MIPGLIGFGIAFFVMFRLKHHFDRDKVSKIQDMSELYPNSIPPKKVLTERGVQLYRWLQIGFGIFSASILFTMIYYAIRG